MELRHRLSLSIPRRKDGTGGTIENTISGPVVAVVREPIPVLRAPLRGSTWVAFKSLGGDAHRRALNPVDGRERIAERFAIDWMSLSPDGRLFHGDPRGNANFYDYGAEVLAVGGGRISDLKDGLPGNGGNKAGIARGQRGRDHSLNLPGWSTVAIYTALLPGYASCLRARPGSV
jgi:hypothetical protein